MSKVLVIDDQVDNLESTKALLNHLMPGLEVLTSLNGQDGIDLAIREQPDTILLDIIMPGMDGYDVCSELKNNSVTKHIPILMLTAIKTDTPSRIKGLQHGADAFFSKPIDPYELTAQVSVLLRIKKSEDKLRQEKKALLENVDIKTKALLENEIKLNQVIEGFCIPGFIIDTNHVITHWNKALEKLTGLKASNMLGTTDHWQIVHKAKHPILVDILIEENTQQELNKHYGDRWSYSKLMKDAVISENSFIDLFDRERYYTCSAIPVFNEEGEVVCAMQTVQDITEQKKLEQELKKHRQDLEKQVKERTKDLEEKNEMLNKMNSLFSHREFRIKELRDKVKELEEEIRELKA